MVICVVRFAVWWWWVWWNNGTEMGAISGTISIDGGLEPQLLCWEVERTRLPFFSAYKLTGSQTLPRAAAPPPAPSSPRAPFRKPVVAELVTFLADFLPVDHLHEHQVPGFSWLKNPGTKGLKGQWDCLFYCCKHEPDPRSFPSGTGVWEVVLLFTLSVLFNLIYC